MGVFAGPEIVEDGLVLALDAGNAKSYPGSGSTWTDLSSNGNNGTLVNNVGYSGDNLGSLSFDGVDDYIDCGNPSISSGKITVNAWVKLNASKTQHIVNSSNNSWHLAILSSNIPYFWNGTTYHTTGNTLTNGVWYMLTGVQGTTLDIYVNGILNSTISTSPNIPTNNINLGRWQNDGSRLFNGNIAQVSIYNRALTASEISQNYNATRGRFGI